MLARDRCLQESKARECVNVAIANFGRLDILINNADKPNSGLMVDIEATYVEAVLVRSPQSISAKATMPVGAAGYITAWITAS
jgi:NAD(P)-dependent dehydrogenase (short-subunit alcohol dehydrogenase family)